MEAELMRTEEHRDFYTCNFGLASFLRFALGDDAHLATMKTDNGRTSFVFRDEPQGTCRQLADAFYSEEGAAVGNARQLLECSRAAKATLAKADRSEDGTWEIEDGL
jgi:hypothetical protein